MSTNNPSGRLFAIMKEGLGISDDTPGSEAWRQLLLCAYVTAEDEHAEVLQQHVLLVRLGKLVSLPAQIRQEIEQLEDVNQEFYLRHIGRFEHALLHRIRFDAKWKHFKDAINGEHMMGLEACDELLSRRRPEPALDDEVLKDLLKQFDDLFEQVTHAELDGDVREFLLTHIERMRHALQTYRISGVRPVIQALEATVGSAVLQPELTERVKATDEGERFWKGMGRAFAALQAIRTAYELVESVARHLPMLTGGA